VSGDLRDLHSFPTRRSSDLGETTMKRHLFHFVMALTLLLGSAVHLASAQDVGLKVVTLENASVYQAPDGTGESIGTLASNTVVRSEEHTSELQSRENLVCRL